MSDGPNRTDAEVADRLNAYLDGELTDDERADVERALADDPALRSEFLRIQRAWDLLDALPKSEVGSGFTQSTVEMIALSAADDLATVEAVRPRRAVADRLLIACGAIVAAAAGYLTIEALRPRSDEALLRDLPVIERLDLYGRTEQGTTVEFLRLLHDRKLLTDLPPNDARRP